MKTLEQLQAELAALPKQSRKAEIQEARITATKNAASTVAQMDPLTMKFATFRDHQVGWRETLGTELFACPSYARTGSELGRLQNLKLSIMTIDRGLGVLDDTGYALETLRLGQLMRESGYVEAPPTDGRAIGRLPWLGSLPAVEQRLKDLQQRRDEAQETLDRLLQDEHVS